MHRRFRQSQHGDVLGRVQAESQQRVGQGRPHEDLVGAAVRPGLHQDDLAGQGHGQDHARPLLALEALQRGLQQLLPVLRLVALGDRDLGDEPVLVVAGVAEHQRVQRLERDHVGEAQAVCGCLRRQQVDTLFVLAVGHVVAAVVDVDDELLARLDAGHGLVAIRLRCADDDGQGAHLLRYSQVGDAAIRTECHQRGVVRRVVGHSDFLPSGTTQVGRVR